LLSLSPRCLLAEDQLTIQQRLPITQCILETHCPNACRKLGLSGAALIHQATLMHQLPPIPSGH
jgi:hypothetical protein